MNRKEPIKTEAKKKPVYVSPEIITYSHDEIVEIIGPAMACTPSDCLPADTFDY